MNELEIKLALLKRFKESINYMEDTEKNLTNKVDTIENIEKSAESKALVKEYTYIFNAILGFSTEELQVLVEKSRQANF